MVNMVSGIVSIAGLVVFLGYYALRINSLPLWLIIIAVVVMAAYDFYRGVRGSQPPSG